MFSSPVPHPTPISPAPRAAADRLDRGSTRRRRRLLHGTRLTAGPSEACRHERSAYRRPEFGAAVRLRLDPIAPASWISSPPPAMAKAKPSSSSKQRHALTQQQNGGGQAEPSKLARYLDPEASWDKDQLLDAVHWIRQAVELACGLLWGSISLVGAVSIALFFAISTGIVYWCLLKIDEEEFGGHGALLQEGMFASFTLFLLSWILVYSLAHF